MADQSQFSCVLLGGTSFLTQCAKSLLNRKHTIVAVVSSDSSVIDWCKKNSIKSISTTSLLRQETGSGFDFLFSLVHFEILPPDVTNMPTKLAINYHDGPLPRYGGINAPSWALMNGERVYGVTWHVMAPIADTGDILKQEMFDISDNDTSFTLNAKCYEAGIHSFSKLVQELSCNRYSRRKHVLDAVTYCPLNKRADNAGMIDWSKTADEIHRQIRALNFGNQVNPLGTPKLYLGHDTLIIKDLSVLPSASQHHPGTILDISDRTIKICTASNDIEITNLMTLDGMVCNPRDTFEQRGLGIKSRLPLWSDQDGQTLSRIDQKLSKHERAWSARLEDLQLLTLPYTTQRATNHRARNFHHKKYSSPAALTRLSAPSDRSGDALLSAIVVYFARLSGRSRFDLGYALPAQAGTKECDLAQRIVPLSVDLDLNADFQAIKTYLRQEVLALDEKSGFSRDLFLRHPAIRKSFADFKKIIEHVVIERIAPISQPFDAPGADLTIRIDHRSGGCSWIYDRNVFSDGDIAKMLRQLDTLISGIASAKSGNVISMPIITKDEQKKIHAKWNATETEIPKEKCIHHLIEDQAARSSERIALAFKDQSLTFRELNERSNQLAHHLRERGIASESLIGVMMDRSIDMVVALFGILKAGAAYVPLDPLYPAARLEFMAEDANLDLIISQKKHQRLLNVPREMLYLDATWTTLSTHSTANPMIDVRPEHLAYLIYTSGSTGKPKGVMIEHRNVINFFVGMDQRIGSEPSGTWLAVTSISFDISLLELFWTLARGFKVVIYSDDARAEAKPPAATRHPGQNIDFSLFYWNLARPEDDAGHKYRLLLESAKFGDTNGFAALWTPERHFHSFGGLFPNPSVISAALAMATNKIQIRAGSCVLPLHNPIRVVEEWSVVDNLSGGRIGISVASGWNPNDFVIKPENYANAKQVMADSIDILRKLWRGETVNFKGPNDKAVAVATLPRPIQPDLPLWMTIASNPETFVLAARHRAGVLTHLLGQNVTQVGENLRLYRKTWAECGHPGQGHVVLMLHTMVGETDDEVRDIVREPMKDYLANAANLVKAAAWHFPTFMNKSETSTKALDEYFDNISASDMDDLLEFAFQRYFSTSGLLGSEARCIEMIDQLKEIGIDEIGCLIDFGIDTDVVLKHLGHLARLRASSNNAPVSVAQEDYSIATLIARHSVTHLQCTPSMLRMLLSDEKNRQALSSLDNILVGGEQLTRKLATDLQTSFAGKLTNMYGPTETTVWSSTWKVNNTPNKISIGKPIANTKFYVLDEHLQELPLGVVGELYIGGTGVARGYFNRPELTAERFVMAPDKKTRIYRTGDLVRYLPNGDLEFVCRADHQVKVRGYRIEPGEIEHVLHQHSDIHHAIVALHEDEAGDKRIVAYLVPREDQAPSAKDVRDFLKGRLPEHMIPSMYVRLDSIPLTPNGKINRKALPVPDVAAIEIDSQHLAPRTATEQVLAEQWETLLNIKPVGVRDNFFDLGGDSILAIQVLCHIMEAFRIQLPLHTIFQSPSIERLARIIEAQRLAETTEDIPGISTTDMRAQPRPSGEQARQEST